MKKMNVLYWVFTGLFCFFMLGSAIPDILMDPAAIAGMHGELGYPLYFVPYIGVAKALGVLALLIPGSARIKEWAWAGLFFDLISAAFSLAALGKPDAFFLALPLSVGATAYYFYRRRQALRAKHSVGSQRSDVLQAA